MDVCTAKQEFDQNGFTVLRGFMQPDEIDHINTELKRYIADVLPAEIADAL